MPYNGHNVGYRDTDTSQAAADAISSKAPTLRDMVLTAIQTAPRPVSAEEVSTELHKPECSIKPRLSELKNAGLIEDSGERGTTQWNKSCILWRLVETQIDMFGSAASA